MEDLRRDGIRACASRNRFDCVCRLCRVDAQRSNSRRRTYCLPAVAGFRLFLLHYVKGIHCCFCASVFCFAVVINLSLKSELSKNSTVNWPGASKEFSNYFMT